MRKDPGFFVVYSFCVFLGGLLAWKIIYTFCLGELLKATLGLPFLAAIIAIITWYTRRYNAQSETETDEDSHVF